MNLPGTAVLNYDVSGPAGDLSSTAVAVYVLGTGKNGSGTDLDLVTSGNARSGVVDLDDDSQWIKNTDVADSNFKAEAAYTTGTGTTNVGVAFKISHPEGIFLKCNCRLCYSSRLL